MNEDQNKAREHTEIFKDLITTFKLLRAKLENGSDFKDLTHTNIYDTLIVIGMGDLNI